MPLPSISVITPCYNGAKYLRETIESVLAQTYPPLEMIIVDDGSTDDSAAIAESFGPPVRVIRQTNQGESAARNRGIAEARGDYLHFLDADDLLHPEALHHLAAAADGTSFLVMGAVWFRDDPRQPLRKEFCEWPSLLPAAVFSPPGPPHAWLLPRTLVDRVGGFDETISYGEDLEFCFRVALTGAPIKPVPFYGAYYRKHSNSQSADPNTVLRRTAGFNRLICSIGERILGDDQLTLRLGDSLFWKALDQLKWSRAAGIPWSDMTDLCKLVAELSRRSGSTSGVCVTKMLMRTIGVIPTYSLRQLVLRSKMPPLGWFVA